MKQVNFHKETTVISYITIYDEGFNEIDDDKLFDNIIDDIGFVLDYEHKYEHEYQGKKYEIVVERTEEEIQYIGFETY